MESFGVAKTARRKGRKIDSATTPPPYCDVAAVVSLVHELAATHVGDEHESYMHSLVL